MALAPVGVEIIGLRPFKLLEGLRRGDFHPLGTLCHDMDIQIFSVGLKKTLLRRNGLIGEAGGVYIAAPQLGTSGPHTGEELRRNVFQRQIQVGMDAPVG